MPSTSSSGASSATGTWNSSSCGSTYSGAEERHGAAHAECAGERLRDCAAPALAVHAVPHGRALACALRGDRASLLPRSPSRSRGSRWQLTLPQTMQASRRCRRCRSSSLRFVRCARNSACRRRKLRRSGCTVRDVIATLSQENADMLSRLARVSGVELAPEALTGNNARSTPSFRCGCHLRAADRCRRRTRAAEQRDGQVSTRVCRRPRSN